LRYRLSITGAKEIERLMTLRIHRAEDGDHVHFNLSGRMKAEHVVEIQRLCELEANAQKLVLDLKEVTLVDRDAVTFLARCEKDGTTLTNCPPYIREWIARERNGN
jgi:anti-anti-sigma regulatory factor